MTRYFVMTSINVYITLRLTSACFWWQNYTLTSKVNSLVSTPDRNVTTKHIMHTVPETC